MRIIMCIIFANNYFIFVFLFYHALNCIRILLPNAISAGLVLIIYQYLRLETSNLGILNLGPLVFKDYI